MKQLQSRSKYGAQFGFSLVELMVVVAIAAILASVAAPSFRSMLVRQRIKTAGADLIAHLALSRSEAIKQNSDVSIASASGNNAWAGGWNISSAGGQIATHAALAEVTISATGTGGASSVVFNRSGRTTTSGVSVTTFQIGDVDTGSAVVGRCVTIGPSGQTLSKDGSCP